MKYYLVSLFFLFATLVEAQDQKSLTKIIKSKVKNGIVINKIMLDHQMVGAKIAIRKNIDESYITHITVKANQQTVYDIETSSYIQKNPYVFFKFKDMKEPTLITLIVTDNLNIQKEQSYRINRTNKNLKILPIKKSTKGIKVKNKERKIKKETRIKEAIEKVYGTRYFVSTNIQVKEIAYSMNGAYIEIKSDENLESISIFSDTNKLATIAIINVPNNIGIVDYKLNIKSERDGKLVIIAKSRQGKFYKAIYPFKNIICNVDGSQPLLSFSIDKDRKLRASTNNAY